MPTLVDSSVLLDTLTGDPRWFDWSSKKLTELGNADELVINPIVFAEVSVHYSTIEDIDQALPPILRRDAIPYEASFLAGKAFRDYRGKGGTRRSPLPDFFIGAHALVAGFLLLTRDPTRFRTYFPALRIVAPASGR
jgi:predicted nucleic acid-binding protein